MKFKTVLKEKAVKTEKSVESLEQKREEMITTTDEILEAATEIMIVKGL
jgi:hypothetical protein